jgi:hypothetical protein
MRHETADVFTSMLADYRHDMAQDVPWADEPTWPPTAGVEA